MPAGRGWQQWNLGARFLDAAFAEELLAGIKRSADFFGFVGFGNRHQLNIVGRATAFLRGLDDLRPNALEVFRDIFHEQL